MTRKSAVGPCWFVIETETVNGEPLVVWLLKQRVSNVYDPRAWERLYSQVQRHIDGLAKTTGCNYTILYWGLPEGVESYIGHDGIEVH